AGVELRNDLEGPLFDGADAAAASALAASHGIEILAIAEVPAFNDGSERAFDTLERLAQTASAVGARGVALIPRNDGQLRDATARRAALSAALERFAPVLERHAVVGFVEPLGFEQSSLRSKREVVDLIEALGLSEHYQLVHDTFHHHLAGERELFPAHTGMVHVSGVVDPSLTPATMTDADRVLVDGDDQLGNLDQLRALHGGGYQGPVSIEAFAPSVHALDAPAAALAQTFHYMRSDLSATAA
ncbi:MAG: TIM barrel protein, partial [Pseudomonadota bacterium]